MLYICTYNPAYATGPLIYPLESGFLMFTGGIKTD